TTHADICASLEMFAREVMPEFHAREAEHQRWKADVLAGRIDLPELDTETYKVYAHQNEDIVRLTPEELKRKMAEKERRITAGTAPAISSGVLVSMKWLAFTSAVTTFWTICGRLAMTSGRVMAPLKTYSPPRIACVSLSDERLPMENAVPRAIMRLKKGSPA